MQGKEKKNNPQTLQFVLLHSDKFGGWIATAKSQLNFYSYLFSYFIVNKREIKVCIIYKLIEILSTSFGFVKIDNYTFSILICCSALQQCTNHYFIISLNFEMIIYHIIPHPLLPSMYLSLLFQIPGLFFHEFLAHAYTHMYI